MFLIFLNLIVLDQIRLCIRKFSLFISVLLEILSTISSANIAELKVIEFFRYFSNSFIIYLCTNIETFGEI